MNRVLLTGATGFIGRNCLQALLAAGYDVHAAGIDPPLADPPRVQWHACDLLAPNQVGELVATVRPSHLLHFAWYAVPGKYWTSPENLRWVQATCGLLHAFAANGGQRALMAGSCAEYDWRYGYCSETVTPLAPTTLYGVCKHAMQTLLSAYSAQMGLSWAWGRVFFLYGPQEHPSRLVASVIRALLLGEPARCTPGEQIRDFTHVADIARAFVALLGSGVTGPVNIASGQPLSIRDLVQRIGEKLGRTDLIRLGALPAPVGEPPLLVADVRRLTREVAWKAEYDLDTGIAQTIAWWRQTLRIDPGSAR